MGNGSIGQPGWSWSEMLASFCALGGAARNIAVGEDGRGLFAVDPAESVLLRVPRNLLFRIDDIEVSDGRIGIRPSADVAQPERQFFESYEDAFSVSGRTRSAAFITALDALPTEIRELLGTELKLSALLNGNQAERIRNHFLENRAVPWRGGRVLAPVLELANHDPQGLTCEWGMHLQIQGFARNEIFSRRGAEDAYETFCRTGVAERRPAAFSLAMTVPCGDREIAVGRKTSASIMRQQHRIPKVSVEGGALTLSYLMLGNEIVPRLPRGTFRSVLREAGMKDFDEVFDQILRANALTFIKLLQALEPYEDEMISTLRTMARYQLEAMAHCVGSREPAPVPTAQA